MYRLITSPEHISAHELPMIEADIDSISKDALTALVPSGQSLQQLRSALEKGRYLLLCDAPKLTLLLKNADTQDWYLNPAASASIGTHLSHVIKPPPEEEHIPEQTGVSGGNGSTNLYQPTTTYSEAPTRSIKERLAKQRQDRADELAEESAKQSVQACFYYRINKGSEIAYSIWSGERQYVADLPWRLIQNGQEIATGKTDSNGRLMVENLPDASPCMLEYGLPNDTQLTKQHRVKVNDYTHIELHSLVLTHFYDDSEQTPVWETPFLITLKNDTTQTGTTDEQGAVVAGPFLNRVSQIEFYPNDTEDSINQALEKLNKDLTIQMDDYAQILADQVKENYQPSHTAEEENIDQIHADFEQAVEDKINELKRQSLEYDAQAWYQKMWDITLASGEGVVDGLSSYLPDLGAFGELLDDMKMDVNPLVVINAITTGDVNDLEAAFQQWKQRNEAGYEQASAQMEILILLMKDPHIRNTLLSLPQRFLAVAPTDALVKMSVFQGSQMGIDSAAVLGATALGAAISGPGGFLAGGLAASGTLARKAASVAEEILETLMSLSENLMKKRNKRTERVSGHTHDSETKSEGKEPDKRPNRCPRCNAIWTRKTPTLSQVRKAVKDTFLSHTDDVKALSQDAQLGYAGSVAKGKVGNPKKSHYGMEPDIRGECGTFYDVDGFLISELAKTIPKRRGKRWANDSVKMRNVEKKIRSSLKTQPNLKYLSKDDKGFSMVVYLPSEKHKTISKGGKIIVN